MSGRDNEYRRFFRRATGLDPYPYQVELACRADWPSVVTAPTGAGKTAAVVLGWLWRHVESGRLFGGTMQVDHPPSNPGGSQPGDPDVKPSRHSLPPADHSRSNGLLSRTLGKLTDSLAHIIADRPAGTDRRLSGGSSFAAPSDSRSGSAFDGADPSPRATGSGDGRDSGKWPSRLVYCLPMRTLVDQTWRNAIQWLGHLELLDGEAHFDQDGVLVSYVPGTEQVGTGKVSVHMLMGGEVDRDWDRRPEALSILVGTQDMLLSRALNRGFATSRFRWPLQFALINNDVLWVLDEVQLMGNGLATSTQLQAFRRSMGTFGPAMTTWMSATFDTRWLETKDFDPARDLRGRLSIGPDDREEPTLKRRLEASKPLQRREFCGWTIGNKKDREPKIQAFAQWVATEHRPGTRTLVVVNTVDRARTVHQILSRLEGLEADLVLLHSRFRPGDRAVLFDRLLSAPGRAGTIAVTTQVVEAGLDISAELLVTDLAPWASMVQRFGRCNRYGSQGEARIVWLDPGELTDKEAAPYDRENLQRAREILLRLEDAAPARLVDHADAHDNLIQLRGRDLIGLFDTTPDLTGADIDVSPFVRGGDERNVSVFWREFEDDPDPAMPGPSREELCPVSLQELDDWLKSGHAWRWDHVDGAWQALWKGQRVPPGAVILIRAADGGYDPGLGWTGKKAKKNEAVAVVGAGAESPSDAHDRDYQSVSSDQGRWQTLAQHTDAVVSALDALIAKLPITGLPVESLLLAARWHDAGKAHPVFQQALAICGPPDASEVWAKAAGGFARYERPGFRHELASAAVMLAQHLDFLPVYLAAAHHGKVRLSVRSIPGEQVAPDGVLFARGVWDGDILVPAHLGGGVSVPETKLRLGFVAVGRSDLGPSWTERSLRLLAELGPFQLAFLEGLLRVADWRGSAVSASRQDSAEVGSDPAQRGGMSHVG